MSFTHGLSLHVTVYIAPENVDLFFAAFLPFFNRVIDETECLLFEVYQSTYEPGKICWVVDWAGTPEWFLKNQITKDYYKEYLAATEPMFIKPREVQFIKPREAQFIKPREFQFIKPREFQFNKPREFQFIKPREFQFIKPREF